MPLPDDPRIDPGLLAQREVERLPPGLFEWRVAEVVQLASSRNGRAHPA